MTGRDTGGDQDPGGAPGPGGDPDDGRGDDARLRLDRTHAARALHDLEGRLDPAAPERCPDVRILGYGELSAALTVDALPGRVCKRMAGFASERAAHDYTDLVEQYLVEVRAAEVRVADTVPLVIDRPGRTPVVYLVQPRLDGDTFGHRLLKAADDHTLAGAIRLALAAVARVARRTAGRTDGTEVAIDGQLSNWSFTPEAPTAAGERPDAARAPHPDAAGPESRGASGATTTPADPQLPEPILIDVGTPFMRRDGKHALDRDYLLSPAPPIIRDFYGRRGLVEAYLDDYFVPRTVALDLLGNFHKEGASERIGLGESVVNQWLATAEIPGPTEPIHVTEVAEYYRRDSELMALYLRLRRLDRFVRTRVLRRGYDFVLPGHVHR